MSAAAFTVEEAAELRGYEFPEVKVGYNTRDVLIYNLGVGASEPCFTFEGDKEFQGALPTFPLCLNLKGSSLDVVPFVSGQAFPLALARVPHAAIVHGEQSISLHKPIPTSAVEGLVHRTRIVDLEDKRSGALLTLHTTLLDTRSGDVIATHLSKVFLKGMGGFASPAPADKPAGKGVSGKQTPRGAGALAGGDGRGR